MSLNRRIIDLVAVSIATALAVALSLVPGLPGVLRVLFGLLLVLFLPGYAVVEACFARSLVDRPLKLMLVLGVSICTAVLGGLVLNLTPLGLTAGSWAVWLGLITLIASSTAIWRRDIAAGAAGAASFPDSIPGPTSADTLAPPRRSWPRRSWPRGAIVKVGMIVVALVVVGVAFAVAQTSAEQQPTPGFTQLWILPVLPTAGMTSPSGAGAGPGGGAQVRIGIESHEHQSYTFKVVVNILVVNVGSQTVSTLFVALTPGQVWERVLTLPPTTTPLTEQVQVLLYREDNPSVVYRHVDAAVQT